MLSGSTAKPSRQLCMVRLLARSVTPSPPSLHITLSPPTVGLQSMSANSAEVRTLLQVLLDNWDASADDFNAQHIAMVGYGLRSLRLPPAVTATALGRDPLPALLVEFSKAIASSKHPLSLGTIASVMYGLQVLYTLPNPSHGKEGVVIGGLVGRQ